ncbi:HAD family hydrolase [Halobacteria archaeon AArc-m2/3/4]|uniref:HAD family hydrolase n=1 Tax=Natronoglomus mannanivorans TaxID=2979990 RepID=A0ABT2QIQ9_9EURY|nr:HAD family hydrolase [Halobacteria archaeon AArc-m2/3/4]
MTAPIDAICFDLDDTLCTYRRSPQSVLEIAFEDVGVSPLFPASEYYDRFEAYLEESTDVVDLRERCFGDLAVEAGADRATGEAVARAYTAERVPHDVELLAGARETVDRFAEDGEYRLALVTNGSPEMQRRKLETIGLEDDFETVVYAGYDAPAKPAPEPFELALEALGTTPDRAVHVGNSLSSDVAGARAAGLRSVWIPDDEEAATPDLKPDWALESLSELAASPPW